MVPLNIVFWVLVLIFGMVGSLRGWNKEILVTFSIVLALFLRLVFGSYVPFVRDVLNRTPLEQFYIYTILVIIMAIVGYTGPVASARLAKRSVRDNLQDVLLSAVLGGVNGYLIVGTIWFFLHAANYGIWGIVSPSVGSAAASLVANSPPVLLTPSWLLTIVALSFVYVLAKLL